MKRIFVALMALFAHTVFAQSNTFPASGNVGIGTTTPSTGLHVTGDVLIHQRVGFQDNARFTVTTVNIPSLTVPSVSMPQYGITAPATNGAAEFWMAGNKGIRMFTDGNPVPAFNLINGNVGIGTLTPSSLLHVNGNATFGSSVDNTYSKLSILGPNFPHNVASKRDISFEFQYAGSAVLRAYRGSNWDTHLQFLTTSYSDNTLVERMHISGDGNVGIGTTTPASKLEINATGSGLRFTNLKSTSPASNALSVDANGDVVLVPTSGLTNGIKFTDTRNVATTPADYSSSLKANFKVSTALGIPSYGYYSHVVGLRGWYDNTGGKAHEMAFSDEGLFLRSGYDPTWGQWRKVIIENESGNVGIGTLSVPGGYKLAVDGNVIAEKIVVKNSTNWPDYVFKRGYRLPGLAEVEKFINQHSHLPEIPSAKDVEANGQDLGEMNRLLLKKVEELTLYMIEMKKENDLLKKRVEKLEK